MWYLILASGLWAFSFGLIKTFLSGVDPSFVACVRLALSFLVFAPALRLRGLGARSAAGFVFVGAVQYGLMYLFYLHAFRYLKASEVAIFTVLTPLYVTGIRDCLLRRFNRLFLLTSALAVAGGALIVAWDGMVTGTLTGAALVQCSNLCFAFGQVWYRERMRREAAPSDLRVFGLLYAGGLAAALPALLLSAGGPGAPMLSFPQLAVLLYLGVIPSGIGFFLWNLGARRANAGTLAVLNNLKIPLAVAAAAVFFGERPDWLPLLIGGVAMLAAVVIDERAAPKSLAKPAARLTIAATRTDNDPTSPRLRRTR